MNIIKRGFTLIELLVVIGILAVLMAGIVALIDPVDKNRAAQDAKVQSDIGQFATALQSFVAQSTNGMFPAGANFGAVGIALQTAGELTSVPTAPANYNAYSMTGMGTSIVTLCGQLQSKKYTGQTPSLTSWVWCSASGRAGPTTACNVCP